LNLAKKLSGYDWEIAYFSKTVTKKRNTAQRILCPLCRICYIFMMDPLIITYL